MFRSTLRDVTPPAADRVVPDVFAPATLGPIAVRNRTVKAATFEGATPEGEVTQQLIDYHLEVARGGIGITTVAYLAVAPEGRTHREVIVLGEDTLPGLARMAEAIHETGCDRTQACVRRDLGRKGLMTHAVDRLRAYFFFGCLAYDM